MRVQLVDRPADAFQQPVHADVLARVCRRALGDDVRVDAVVELPWGSYNSVYRLDCEGRPPLVLRVAPAPGRPYRVENAMMRNEYAAVPYLAPVGELLPRILFADFTHQLVDRDFLVQTVLPGVPAPQAMGGWSRSRGAELFAEIGAVTRRLHDVAGRAFGPVAGPGFATWSEALAEHLRTAALDVRDTGHDPRDVLALAAEAERHADALDEVRVPRLLHGDGWTANFLVDPRAGPVTVTGVCDFDRAEWGDPLADWGVQRALLRPGTERDAFWEGYGQPRPEATGVRQLLYRARHAVALRLDLLRPGRTTLAGYATAESVESVESVAGKVAATYDEVGGVLDRLGHTA